MSGAVSISGGVGFLGGETTPVTRSGKSSSLEISSFRDAGELGLGGRDLRVTGRTGRTVSGYGFSTGK